MVLPHQLRRTAVKRPPPFLIIKTPLTAMGKKRDSIKDSKQMTSQQRWNGGLKIERASHHTNSNESDATLQLVSSNKTQTNTTRFRNVIVLLTMRKTRVVAVRQCSRFTEIQETICLDWRQMSSVSVQIRLHMRWRLEAIPLRAVTVLIKPERKILALFCTFAGQLDQPIRMS